MMIRKQPDVEEGEIAAVVINGDNEATLKRVKRQNGLTMLIPDNTNYKPYIITE
ncbi:XRE family transcriptional regulator [Enterococcus faecium]|nr:XRE family transcriptional regulator [Enterococcus faecium]